MSSTIDHMIQRNLDQRRRDRDIADVAEAIRRGRLQREPEKPVPECR